MHCFQRLSSFRHVGDVSVTFYVFAFKEVDQTDKNGNPFFLGDVRPHFVPDVGQQSVVHFDPFFKLRCRVLV